MKKLFEHTTTLLTIFVLVFAIFLSACSDSTSPDNDDVVYFTSFESAQDFEDWSGISDKNWNTDTHSDKNKRSVYISGGCVIPHAQYEISDLDEGYYTIECWGKAVAKTQGGGVVLTYCNDIAEENCTRYLNFSDTVWTNKTSEPIFLPENASLSIQLNAGGFVASSMLIDEISVRKAAN